MDNHIFRSSAAALATACLLGFAGPGLADQNDDILVELEQPVEGQHITGVGIIRGWAAAPAGIDYVELFINDDPDSGSPNQIIAYGGSRVGVCNAIGGGSTSYPDCVPEALPGFASTFNFNLLTDGENTFTVRAYDSNGDHNDDSSTFTSRSLGDEFISDDDRIVLPAFVVDGVRKKNPGNDQSFDIEFEWSRASQRFVMSRITEYDPLPFVVPTPPSDLTATSDSGNVELTWTPPAGPGSERWFVIERKFDSAVVSGDFQVIGVVPEGTDSFTDENVTLTVSVLPGTYTYRVLTALPWTTASSDEVTVSQTLLEIDPPDLSL